MNSPEEKLHQLNLQLPAPPKPLGAYKPAARAGNLLFSSGTLPFDAQGNVVAGRIGTDLSIPQGQAACRLAALNALAAIRAELGSLNRVQQVVRLVGYLQTSMDFQDHAQVMNGASDLMTEVFGDLGRHARLTLGIASLPRNAAVELEMIVSIL